MILSLSTWAPGQTITFDILTDASSVSEPAVAALLAVGLLGLTLSRKGKDGVS